MSWFKRVKEGILTSTKEKKNMPEGIWNKCPVCKAPITQKELEDNNYVCTCEESYHFRIGSKEYFSILFDDGKFEELYDKIKPADPLKFKDKKAYTQRIKDAQSKTNLNDAIRIGKGKLQKIEVIIGCMDFSFIGGSMGAVVGEKIAKAIDLSREEKLPLIIISKSGGARMMESAYSLMQMAKTASKLALLEQEGVPFISVLTDPTTGGVTASFSMLGDLNIAEPKALIGFAGPRVIKETIGRDLPEGFQRSEFLMEHGFLDFIVDRRQLKNNLSTLLRLILEDELKTRKKRKTNGHYKNTNGSTTTQDKKVVEEKKNS